ncbi:MAG: hypothetical protein LUQ38_12250 [Methanotrichaceae archaeon]|nr:hypothetical protein [Methanotrichaceae archaeon]MDD1757451.1 hypothetical protein [Methanotrichaceae archaeon]
MMKNSILYANHNRTTGEIETRISAIKSQLAMLAICSSSASGMAISPPEYVVPQGIIELDSEFARKIGFVSSRFLSCSYLWGEGNRIVINTIECTDRRRGYLRDLFKAIWALGAEIAVRTPLYTMQLILVHYGFVKVFMKDPIRGTFEYWVKSPEIYI